MAYIVIFHNCLEILFQINSAVSSDRAVGRWIDLGIHTEACMTQPDTCGENGCAVSLWHKVVSCPSFSGIVSSHSLPTSTGITVYCGSSTLG